MFELKQNKEVMVLVAKNKNEVGEYDVVIYDPCVVFNNDISQYSLKKFLEENLFFDSVCMYTKVCEKNIDGSIPRTRVSSLMIGVERFIDILSVPDGRSLVCALQKSSKEKD